MLESLFQASLPESHRVEIMVVDNNSNDATKAVVENYSARGYPGLTYIFEGRQGKSHALNTALTRISGDIVAFTDDDAMVDPEYYLSIIRAVEKYPHLDCFGGIIEPVYPDNLPAWMDLDGRLGFLKSAFVDRRDGTVEAPYETLGFSPVPSGCNMFFRRSAININGEFRTDLGPQGKQLGFDEDSEYCRRLVARGRSFMFIPSVIVRHPVYPERLTPQYLWDWRYQCGKSMAISDTDTTMPKLLGIPRYLFRKCLEEAAGFGLSGNNDTSRAFHKYTLAYNLGQIHGYWNKRNS